MAAPREPSVTSSLVPSDRAISTQRPHRRRDRAIDAGDDPELVLVRDQVVGRLEQLRAQRRRGRGIQDRSAAALVGGPKGRRRHALRDLELADDDADAVERADGAAAAASASTRSFAPGTTMIRFVPSGSTQIGATPLEPSTRATWVASTPCRSRFSKVIVGVDVVAERADHRDAATEARRHHGLVRALAAEAHLEALADDRLARVRHTLRVGDQVDVQAADDDDDDWGPVPCGHRPYIARPSASGGRRRDRARCLCAHRLVRAGGRDLRPVGRRTIGPYAARTWPQPAGACARRSGTVLAPRDRSCFSIVFGVLLALVGVTATAQAVMVSVYASSSSLNAIVQSDLATLRGFAHQGLDPALLDEPALPPEERAALEGLMSTLTSKGEILLVELRLPDGRVLASSDSSSAGSVVQPGAEFTKAVGEGRTQVSVVDRDAAETGAQPASGASLLREYLPLMIDGEVVLVVGMWRDAGPILGGLDQLRQRRRRRDDHGRGDRSADPVPGLPGSPGPAHPPVARAPGGEPPRSLDGRPQSRRGGRDARRGDRAGTAAGSHPRRGSHRRRRLPPAQRHARPPRR